MANRAHSIRLLVRRVSSAARRVKPSNLCPINRRNARSMADVVRRKSRSHASRRKLFSRCLTRDSDSDSLQKEGAASFRQPHPSEEQASLLTAWLVLPDLYSLNDSRRRTALCFRNGDKVPVTSISSDLSGLRCHVNHLPFARASLPSGFCESGSNHLAF